VALIFGARVADFFGTKAIHCDQLVVHLKRVSNQHAGGIRKLARNLLLAREE
jgi:hypothetical protein